MIFERSVLEILYSVQVLIKELGCSDLWCYINAGFEMLRGCCRLSFCWILRREGLLLVFV
jgi:hypothetical protein